MLAVLLAAAAQAASPAAPAGGEVVVELVVEDARGQPIRDLKTQEVTVAQDGDPQAIASLLFVPERGWYELRYAPGSGRAGAVSVRVLRGGSRLRGPDGPQLRPRWVPPVADFERPLRAALEAAPAAGAGLAYETTVLRFEPRGDALHHSVLADVAFRDVLFVRAGPRQRARLAFLLRVTGEDGRVVHEGSLEQPLEVDAVRPGGLDVRRFVWSSHMHLRPGRYQADLVVRDVQAERNGVRRTALVVEPWPAGLRLSSLAFLLGLGGLMAGSEADNPLRLDDQALVPMVRPTWVAGSEGAMSLLAVVYPDRSAGGPVTATVELHRGGQLRSRAQVALPAPGPGGEIRYVGGLKFGSMQPGSYTVKLVAQQGAARAEESVVLEVIATPLRRVE